MHPSLRLAVAFVGIATTSAALFAAAPVIQKSDSIGITLGDALDYHVIALGDGRITFTAQGLPAGATLDPSTGYVSGTPTLVGTYPVTITATNADGSSSTKIALNVVDPSAGPLIYAPLTFDAYSQPHSGGDTFSCTLKATGSPTKYEVTSTLPANWTFAGSTITGPTTQPGLVMVPVTATNTYGIGSAAVTIRIHPACTGVQQTTGNVKAGDTFHVTLQLNRAVTFSGSAPYIELQTADGTVRRAQYVSGNGTDTLDFAYTISSTDAAGSLVVRSSLQPLAAGGVDGVADQDGLALGASLPNAGPGVPGATIVAASTNPPTNPAVASTASATGSSPSEGVASTPSPSTVASATSGTGSSPVSTAAASTTTISNATGSAGAGAGAATGATSVAGGGAGASVSPASTSANSNARLVNLSSRATAADGGAAQSFIAGFVVSGASPKRMVLRVVGPSLADFGVQNALANPQLRVRDASGTIVAENDDWSGSDVATTSAVTGAFALKSGSRDAAVVVSLPPGNYSMQVVAGGGSGVALAEIYDADGNGATPLANLSTRGFVGSGEGVLTAGFVVSGTGPKRVLVRGIGPALAAYGVSGALPDPKLAVYQNNSVVAENDNWDATAASEIAAASASVGAFALKAGSSDAALVTTLQPGAYTAMVSSANGSTGAGLVEVYQLP